MKEVDKGQKNSDPEIEGLLFNLGYYEHVFNQLDTIVQVVDVETNTLVWSGPIGASFTAYREAYQSNKPLNHFLIQENTSTNLVDKNGMHDSDNQGDEMLSDYSGMRSIRFQNGETQQVWLVSKLLKTNSHHREQQRSYLFMPILAESAKTSADPNDSFQSLQLKYKRLTKREKEIFALVAAGESTVEIAVKLKRSKHTIESHRSNILKKFEAKRMTELISFATQLGIIK